MKLTIKYLAATALASLAIFSSCQTDYDAPGLQDSKATMTANTSIANLKTLLAEEPSIQIPMKDEASATPYIIKGRVISSDVSGNIFKQLVIQDETAAIQFSIDAGQLYTNYRVGQEIVVNVTGLWGGLYHGLVCLGAGADEYGSLVTSRMPFFLFREHTELNGLPNENTAYVKTDQTYPSDRPYCIILDDISKLPTSGQDLLDMQSQLVEFPNVKFDIADGVTPLAPQNENANRTISNITGSIDVRFSGQSNIYNTPLPVGIGTVRGILSYYNDSWQVLIRDLNDLMFDGKGTKDKPYTVEEAIAMHNNGRNVWTEGYIVGSVKAGVSTVSSDSDILFGPDADLDNTLVIAQDKDCKDFSKCMVVALPASTNLRKYGNLADNPGNYGKRIIVLGKYSEYLGINGIVDCPGKFADFDIEGLVIPGITGEGTGTSADPYTVNFILYNPEPQTGIYVTGYIVGFVAGSSYINGAHFDANTAGMDYNNGNVIIAASPDVNDIAKAIPVKLTVADRKVLGLGNAPGVLGKKVVFKGDIGTYLGTVGLNPTESSQLVP